MKSNFIYLGFYFSYAKRASRSTPDLYLFFILFFANNSRPSLHTVHFNALLAMFNARSKLLNGRTPPISGVSSGDGISGPGAISNTSYRLSRFAAASRSGFGGGGANAGGDTKFTSIIAPVSPALDGRFGVSSVGSMYSVCSITTICISPLCLPYSTVLGGRRTCFE